MQKRAQSRADTRTTAGNFPVPPHDSSNEFWPYAHLNNYKASYFFM